MKQQHEQIDNFVSFNFEMNDVYAKAAATHVRKHTAARQYFLL